MFGTASYAIGLVAYNTNRRDLSRRFIFQSIFFVAKFFIGSKDYIYFYKIFDKPIVD